MMSNWLQIFQIMLDPDRPPSEPGYLPFHWSRRPDGILREAVIFDHAYRNGIFAAADYTGLLSAKFFAKSGLRVEALKHFIAENPGYDIYLFNPYPYLKYFTFNVWEQGEFHHHGIIEAAQGALHQLGYRIDLDLIGRNDEMSLVYCNYWVAHRDFWQRFLDFASPVYHLAVKHMKLGSTDGLLAPTTYQEPLPLFPFIYERLISTFLLVNDDIKVMPWVPNRGELLARCPTMLDQAVISMSGDFIDEKDRRHGFTAEDKPFFRSLHYLQAAVVAKADRGPAVDIPALPKKFLERAPLLEGER